ncbi:MAG TPA: Rpn family recombination-promoting nuclease/putative transposase [Prevotella sp.]|uniref:Rpn family recombination-promoting nuclease/putative transposase n=1 Tax=Prevotella sp. TaxID=59823 RepID=UPI002C2EDAFA|nr:Rpn family recombination-promoting nuclease/putative transposase [Prevotella sp.]
MKYLDPKVDLIFKKIFSKHPDLLMSLLNALLPLSDDEQIQSIKYLPTELVPELYEHKNSIVDVLCEDVKGRKFCVEMQMEWSNAFQQRVLFNASKLYVSQAATGEDYDTLKPVYSLNLVNAIFERDMPDTFIHNYKIVHDKDSKKVINGLHFTFIELPKFKPQSMLEKRMAVLWLRFLTEINASTDQVPEELTENPEINKALEELKVTAFTDAELRAYDKALDNIRVERTLLNDRYKKGLEKGKAEGITEGIEKVAKMMLLGKMPDEQITAYTGLTQEQINSLKNQA